MRKPRTEAPSNRRSRQISSSPLVASPWARTTSCVESRPSSEFRRSSGGSRSSPASRSPSASAAGRWSSARAAIRSPRLSAFCLSSGPLALALRGVPDPLPGFDQGRLVGGRRRNPERDELVRARLRQSADGPLLEPLSGQESHMIARSAEADALVFVARGEGEVVDGQPVEYLRLT